MRPMAPNENGIPGNAGRTRESKIIRTSIIGIGANVLLAAFKAACPLIEFIKDEEAQ